MSSSLKAPHLDLIGQASHLGMVREPRSLLINIAWYIFETVCSVCGSPRLPAFFLFGLFWITFNSVEPC